MPLRSVEDGGACSADDLCADDRVCFQEDYIVCQGGCREGRCIGDGSMGEGDRCYGTRPELCEEGLHCFYESSSEDFACLPPVGEGGDCKDDLNDEEAPRANQCEEGLSCGSDGTCSRNGG